MDEIAKGLGDLSALGNVGTFGLFAIALVWVVLKIVVPALKGERSSKARTPADEQVLAEVKAMRAEIATTHKELAEAVQYNKEQLIAMRAKGCN